MKNFICLLAVLLTFSPLSATAHPNEYLDAHPELSVHGGQTRMIGLYHFEILTTENELTIYVTDHGGNPLSAEGTHGTAIIITPNGSRTTINLAPAGDNFLKGSGILNLTGTTDVWVAITFPDQKIWEAKFTPLAGKKEVEEKTDHSNHHH